ncbi:fasciclin domain-containing protein [Zeaxanthinibacter sp. PT1]|uniref:fasciclin domain-containing protein n=1 Tax=Zeaxanthinibacter TaxID=561554 RepID=UPI0023499C43|nr:fasciclin domain-containing protein [Zeaxanthinibacter sp. PT1]MDC6350123.1 fasciclin domain-containing protein [Zeaxanthinibacter sp. PT1]
MIKNISLWSLIALLFVACGEKKEKKDNMEAEKMETVESYGEEMEEETPTIVGVAVDNADFSTLVTALQTADLVDALNGEGEFTVFAPTNAAFDQLPDGALADLLKPENKETLTSVLTYHVVPGLYTASDVVQALKNNDGTFTAETLQGSRITFKMEGDKVVLYDNKGNAVNLIATDIEASNGYIHSVDTVLMP